MLHCFTELNVCFFVNCVKRNSGLDKNTNTNRKCFLARSWIEIEQQILDIFRFLKCFLSAFTEQYFRNDGATLNERFSAPQQGGYSEEETEELTLDERFSSNRYVEW